jgi:hypothetical protein
MGCEGTACKPHFFASTFAAWRLGARIILGLGLTVVLLRAGIASGQQTPAATPAAAAKEAALLSRPADGTAKFTGLAAPVQAGVIPRWPVELSPIDAVRRACSGAACTQWEQLDLALNRAAHWMAAYSKQLQLDAAMGLVMIRQTVDGDALRAAFETARRAADRDHDNPHRRFWTPDFTAPPEHTSRWKVPADGQRVNTNRTIEEALFCKEYGWRPETMRYVCGPMRDDGGYYTTHALWALYVANGNGCIAAAELEPCVKSMHEEIAAKQTPTLTPAATLDIDLYAERLLTAVLTGYPDATVNDWAQTLLRLQSPDGSWGVPKDGEEPYYRYHATFVSTWALAEWYRRLVGHPETRP